MHRIFPTDVKELKSGGEYIRARAKGKWLFFIRAVAVNPSGAILSTYRTCFGIKFLHVFTIFKISVLKSVGSIDRVESCTSYVR
ncbi:hypothetical protein C9I99_19575 [Photobacterium lutimaris]|uniref:Uncharacterized protein n=1 Tax=Photobacterium lutimaris TaxID=388278 RepID=A0A2T3IUF4_9GAMM|nr:hypothetical protein C9I99_19575 [Photobacterium lutimaris]